MRPGFKGALIAVTVASLFATRAIAEGKAEAKTVECAGVNAFKGQGACAGAGHDCAGKNACKGQGFLKTTAEDCKAKGGEVES